MNAKAKNPIVKVWPQVLVGSSNPNPHVDHPVSIVALREFREPWPSAVAVQRRNLRHRILCRLDLRLDLVPMREGCSYGNGRKDLVTA